jgi:hypothetical protein
MSQHNLLGEVPVGRFSVQVRSRGGPTVHRFAEAHDDLVGGDLGALHAGHSLDDSPREEPHGTGTLDNISVSSKPYCRQVELNSGNNGPREQDAGAVRMGTAHQSTSVL